MPDSNARTNEQLRDEVRSLRAHIAELESRKFDQRTRAWLEHSPVCTEIVDLDFNLQYMNGAGADNLDIDDIRSNYGRPYPFDFHPKAFRDRMTGNLNRVVETGAIVTQEAPVVDTDGNEIWFHSTLDP